MILIFFSLLVVLVPGDFDFHFLVVLVLFSSLVDHQCSGTSGGPHSKNKDTAQICPHFYCKRRCGQLICGQSYSILLNTSNSRHVHIV